MAAPTFDDWMARVRAGDAVAAAELVGQYERAVRVAVRVRLTDPKLRRQFDSLDVCQSVLASFFVRAATGQYDLDRPEQLVGLLLDMARGREAQAFDRAIDTLVSRLRRKLEVDPKKPELIKTVWGGGYMFSAEVRHDN